MQDVRKLLVFGAEGATGKRIIADAVGRGIAVRASEMKFAAPEDMLDGVEKMEADVLSDDLAPVVRGCDAVISALGVPNDISTLADPPPLYTDGTRNILRAMKAEGVTRFVTISATFLESPDRGPLLFRFGAQPALHNVFEQMEEMERILAASGTRWTAVRPGWLLDLDAFGDATVRADTIPEGMIRTRQGDLARFMLDCALSEDWVGSTPAIARREAEEYEGSAAVAREMMGG